VKYVLYSIVILLIVLLITGCPELTPESTPGLTPIPTLEPTTVPPCSIVVTFPDANLEALIRAKIDKPAGEIYLCDVESITSLYSDESNISDLTGIENLTSLLELTLYSNNISDISALVDNSGIDDGDYISLGNNPLSDDSVNIFIPELEARGVNVYF
jgi:Leucine-rich repeat (LRR) protein